MVNRTDTQKWPFDGTVKTPEGFNPQDGDFIVGSVYLPLEPEPILGVQWISILQGDFQVNYYQEYAYMYLKTQHDSETDIHIGCDYSDAQEEVRYATDEEKAHFISKLKSMGMKWNAKFKIFQTI